MGPLILAAECDPAQPALCVPPSVNELFESDTVFHIGSMAVNRTMLLMVLASLLVIIILAVAYARPRLIPSKLGAAIEALVSFVRDQVAVEVIGPDGVRFFPYLLSLFLFILVANLFGILPFVNFPVASRMALPLFLALLTWVTFIVVGIVKNGPGYFLKVVWPRSVPVGLRPFIGLLEFLSTFIIQPFTLAVRLFANMMAGHLLLSLLLVSGVVFVEGLDAKSLLGLVWFGAGLAIFVFEALIAVLQAYIFTLLSAVYIGNALHPEL